MIHKLSMARYKSCSGGKNISNETKMQFDEQYTNVNNDDQVKLLNENMKNNNDKDELDNKSINTEDNVSFSVDFLPLPNLEIYSSNESVHNLNEKYDNEKSYPQITDLCYDDRLRISRLIEEIARCKERNVKDTNIITDLQEEKFKMTMEINILEKQITKLLTEREEKETEIMQLNRNHSIAIQEHKTKIIELRLKIDEMTENIKAQQEKIYEINGNAVKVNDSYATLSKKYKNIKRKLKKSIYVIKKLIKESRDYNIKITKEKSCQIPSPEEAESSNVNLELECVPSDVNLPTPCASVEIHSNSELSLLSDLFFKPVPPSYDENNEAVILLQEQDNISSKNKYFE